IITGNKDRIARLHPAIKGVRGANTQGAALVSYNLPPFNSYGKKQNYNSSIGQSTAFSYTTALNLLLNKDSHNKITIADSTIVFWSEKQTTDINPEEIFPWVIAMQKSENDDPDAGVNKIKKLFEAIQTGQLSLEKTNHFYVLGLAPNAARISIRFWKAPSIEDFGKNIKQHFEDFEIIHGPKEQKYLSLYQILSSTALAYKMDNVPPNLAGAVIESIIDGTLYPQSLLQQCIRRIRAEQNVNRTRAAILKACLNRKIRIQKLNQKEITMSLDPNNTNVAYRTGRLFATLEKIQEEANPGINATIRDRYYGAASSSPITVFPRLLSLKNSHLKKLNEGRKIYFEKLIGEILSEVKSFPTNLSLNEQANFAIGYYHQRQDFFTKKSDSEEKEITTNNN
ncbi:MAG: type I-C CRISPR-associated protein Cas8c/Csd1, partial [Ignavibacterium sp.]